MEQLNRPRGARSQMGGGGAANLRRPIWYLCTHKHEAPKKKLVAKGNGELSEIPALKQGSWHAGRIPCEKLPKKQLRTASLNRTRT